MALLNFGCKHTGRNGNFKHCDSKFYSSFISSSMNYFWVFLNPRFGIPGRTAQSIPFVHYQIGQQPFQALSTSYLRVASRQNCDNFPYKLWSVWVFRQRSQFMSQICHKCFNHIIISLWHVSADCSSWSNQGKCVANNLSKTASKLAT